MTIPMMITSRWLRYCIRKAKKYDTNQRYKFHAVLVKGGSIQGEGQNISVQDCGGQVFNPHAPEWIGLHAEMSCLKRASDRQIEGATLYVGGVTQAGKLITTAPCDWCGHILDMSGLFAVVWHDSIGNQFKSRLPYTEGERYGT
jgi:tRNA(Arg) A34 adenosine deaminase TadA